MPIDYAAQLGHSGVVRAMVEESKKREKREGEERGGGGREECHKLVEDILKVGRKLEMDELWQKINLLSMAAYLGYSSVVKWLLTHSGFKKYVTFLLFIGEKREMGRERECDGAIYSLLTPPFLI